MFFYRGMSAFALAIVFFAAVNFVYRAGQGDPMISVAALLAAAVVWLIGWFCRYAFVPRA
jgi:uncharacterized membrane protein